ncbi:MAG TPA: PD-(D/E)XK nuclease family protein [Clostridiales bacterium]|nr:PD-(D/E)XK nuclease family protein [Clostridiales bacterium]
MYLDDNFFFSQYSLNIFRRCPVRFKKRYIEGLYWRGVQPNGTNLERGRHFHILADRYFSNIPLNMKFFEEYGTLNDWMDALKEYIPKTGKGKYYPEYSIRIDDGDMKLQAKYDLVYVDLDGNITIYDWKTEEYPLSYKVLATSMQTIVYRYVMAVGGSRLKGAAIAPEDITMIYWQPKFPDRPIELFYNRRQFEKDREFLKSLIGMIQDFDYESYDKSRSAKYCQSCEFNYFCNTDKVEYNSIFSEEEIELDDWDDIEDIYF